MATIEELLAIELGANPQSTPMPEQLPPLTQQTPIPVEQSPVAAQNAVSLSRNGTPPAVATGEQLLRQAIAQPEPEKPKGDGNFLQRLVGELAKQQGSAQAFQNLAASPYASPLEQLFGGFGGGIISSERAKQAQGFAEKVAKAETLEDIRKLLPQARTEKERQLVSDSMATIMAIAEGDRAERKLGLDETKTGLEINSLLSKLGSGGRDTKDLFADTKKLRDEFVKLGGEFIEQRDAYGRVVASAKEASAAGDLAMVFNFMKVLDPGSTVREGEFANAAKAAGLGERFIAAANKIDSGQILSEKQRADFLDRAGKLFNTAEVQHNKLRTTYSTLAEKSQLPVDQVVIDLGFVKDGQASSPSGKVLVFNPATGRLE